MRVKPWNVAPDDIEIHILLAEPTIENIFNAPTTAHSASSAVKTRNRTSVRTMRPSHQKPARNPAKRKTAWPPDMNRADVMAVL